MSTWYEVVSGTDLEQGDLFFGCEVPVPRLDLSTQSPTATIEMQTRDVIVLTQSCDLMNGKALFVFVCQVLRLPDLEAVPNQKLGEFFRQKNNKEKIRRGEVVGYHMLASCLLDGFQQPILIVDFREINSLPFDYLRQVATTSQRRLRLMSPYREHLSQAFARMFMRVGLPADIPPFT